MSNVTYFVTRRHMTPEAVEAALREILDARFPKAYTLSRRRAYMESSLHWKRTYKPKARMLGFWWDLRFPALDVDCTGFEIRLVGKQVVQSQDCHWDALRWAQYFVMESLTSKFGGRLGSENLGSERWDPEPSKYPTYAAWVARGYNWLAENKPEEYQTMLTHLMRDVPPGW